jgi:protein TonB
MQTNRILSASLLDILFEGRNKAYGAYYLRATYEKRIKKSIIITFSVAALVIGSTVLANSFKKNESNYRMGPEIELTNIPDEKKPEKLPEPPKKVEQQQVETVKLTPPVITPDEEVKTPPPSQADMEDALIGQDKIAGVPDDGIEKPAVISDGQDKGVIETKPEPQDDNPLTIVEIEAKFTGDWRRFLLKNLNPEVPADNKAPAGRYTVLIRFVVDKEGNVSDITPLTNQGYGMEEEAMRVLRLAANKWEPAIQNGYKAKAYHKQMITFEVVDSE